MNAERKAIILKKMENLVKTKKVLKLDRLIEMVPPKVEKSNLLLLTELITQSTGWKMKGKIENKFQFNHETLSELIYNNIHSSIDDIAAGFILLFFRFNDGMYHRFVPGVFCTCFVDGYDGKEHAFPALIYHKSFNDFYGKVMYDIKWCGGNNARVFSSRIEPMSIDEILNLDVAYITALIDWYNECRQKNLFVNEFGNKDPDGKIKNPTIPVRSRND